MLGFGCYRLGFDQHLVKSQGRLPHEGDTVGSMRKSLRSHFNGQRNPWNHYWIWSLPTRQNLKDPLDPDTLIHHRGTSVLCATLHLSNHMEHVLFTGCEAENTVGFPEIFHVTGAFLPNNAFPVASQLEHRMQRWETENQLWLFPNITQGKSWETSTGVINGFKVNVLEKNSNSDSYFLKLSKFQSCNDVHPRT